MAGRVTVTFTKAQARSVWLAIDDHRQNEVDNGHDTRALDNAAERLVAAMTNGKVSHDWRR